MAAELEISIASHRLGLSYHQVYRLVLIGLLSGRKVDGRWRVDEAAVEALVRQRQAQSR